MNTPIVFPFKNCDKSDLTEIQDYTLVFEQDNTSSNEYLIPNKPIQSDYYGHNSTEFGYTESEWDVNKEKIEPNGTFNGDIVAISSNTKTIVSFYRKYFVKLVADVQAGTITVNVGGTTYVVSSNAELISSVIESEDEDTILLTFSSDFAGSFSSVELNLLDTKTFERTEDCSTFSSITETYQTTNISINPFPSSFTEDTYTLKQLSFLSGIYGNKLSSYVPDNGFNYTKNVDTTIGDGTIDLDGGSAFAMSNATLTTGTYYKIEFVVNGAIDVGVYDTVFKRLFSPPTDEGGRYSFYYIGEGEKLRFEGDGTQISSIKIREVLPNYSFSLRLVPNISSCSDEQLINYRWRNGSNVGGVDYCNNPLFYNEVYLTSQLLKSLPIDEDFTSYVDGCTNWNIAYSNQFEVIRLILLGKVPNEIFSMINLASKQSEFYINDVKYKSIQPIADGNISDSGNYISDSAFRLVKDNGNEITNCSDC